MFFKKKTKAVLIATTKPNDKEIKYVSKFSGDINQYLNMLTGELADLISHHNISYEMVEKDIKIKMEELKEEKEND